jgi:hypothetical protein
MQRLRLLREAYVVRTKFEVESKGGPLMTCISRNSI